MPIYEYVCQECGEKFEKLVRSSSGTVELVCPRCGSTHAEKTLSLFGLSGLGGASSGAATPAPSCGPVG
jgi:putative FmdB family regulatory protein